MTLHDRLLASINPVRGRRLLDQIENGVRPTTKRRRIAAVMKPPGISYTDWLRQYGYEDLDSRLKGDTK